MAYQNILVDINNNEIEDNMIRSEGPSVKPVDEIEYNQLDIDSNIIADINSNNTPDNSNDSSQHVLILLMIIVLQIFVLFIIKLFYIYSF